MDTYATEIIVNRREYIKRDLLAGSKLLDIFSSFVQKDLDYLDWDEQNRIMERAVELWNEGIV